MEREKITNRAHGIDVSHYQTFFAPKLTWGQIDFAIAKIGEGYNTPYVGYGKFMGDETEFLQLWNGVSQLEIRGVYFYQRSGYSWEAQARKVIDYIKTLEVKPHMLWLDLEKIGNTIDKTMLADSLRILRLWKSELPSIKVGLYSNPDVVNNYLVPIGTKYFGKSWVDEIMSYPQWIAQYWWIKSPDKQPGTYKQYPNWDLWQYSDSADSYKIIDGIRFRHYGSPDVNVYNGTVEEMKQWLGITNNSPQTLPNIGTLLRSDASRLNDQVLTFHVNQLEIEIPQIFGEK